MSEQTRDRQARQMAQAGFTLIEVLLVVAIIGILAGVVAVNFAGRGEKAAIKATRASIAAVSTAVKMYEVDTGRYPSGLQALVSDDGSPNWSGPYIEGGMPKDSWGMELGYSKAGDSGFKVISAGPDMSMGSGDDITSF